MAIAIVLGSLVVGFVIVIIALEVDRLNGRIDRILNDPVREIEREHQRILSDLLATEAAVRGGRK